MRLWPSTDGLGQRACLLAINHLRYRRKTDPLLAQVRQEIAAELALLPTPWAGDLAEVHHFHSA